MWGLKLFKHTLRDQDLIDHVLELEHCTHDWFRHVESDFTLFWNFFNGKDVGGAIENLASLPLLASELLTAAAGNDQEKSAAITVKMIASYDVLSKFFTYDDALDKKLGPNFEREVNALNWESYVKKREELKTRLQDLVNRVERNLGVASGIPEDQVQHADKENAMKVLKAARLLEAVSEGYFGFAYALDKKLGKYELQRLIILTRTDRGLDGELSRVIGRLKSETQLFATLIKTRGKWMALNERVAPVRKLQEEIRTVVEKAGQKHELIKLAKAPYAILQVLKLLKDEKNSLEQVEEEMRRLNLLRAEWGHEIIDFNTIELARHAA